MPMVQPKAAAMLGRKPRDSPAAKVYKTPVPGEATTIRDVIKNSTVMTCTCTKEFSRGLIYRVFTSALWKINHVYGIAAKSIVHAVASFTFAAKLRLRGLAELYRQAFANKGIR